MPVPGIPFDERKGVLPNREGRVLDGNSILPGVYCAGWIKRGPTGIIGTNRADSVATVNSLLADLPALEPGTEKIGADALLPLLAERGVRTISFSDWLKIDAAEVSRGKAKDKPREKFTRYAEILQLLGS